MAHDVADHPARQLHLGVLVFGHVRKPAHHLGLDGVVYVHQHVEPFRALHAGCARHARFLCRRAEECRRTLLHAAHGPGVVHDGLVLFRRVAVPVSLCLPQLHAVAPGLGYRLCPISVPLYKLRLGFAVLVYRVGQVMQVGVLVPQLRVPVGGLVQYLARQRLGQSLRLGHVRALRAQILHQRPRLVCQLRPVGPAAVGLDPSDGEALEGSVREPGVLRQAEELVQGVKGRCLLRQYPAGLPLLVLLCLPVGLLGPLVAESCQLTLCREFPGLVVFPNLSYDLVGIHLPAVLLAGSHPPVGGGDVEGETPFLAAQLLHHRTDLSQLLFGRRGLCRNVNARGLSHHTHIAVCQKLVQGLCAVGHLRRAERVQYFSVVSVPGAVILCKIQHPAIRQDIPCLFKTVCCSKLLHGQLPAVLRLSARRLGLGIIHLLLLLLHGLSGVFHFALRLPQLIVHFADAAFQFCAAPVELLALFQIALVLFAGPECLALFREQAIGFFLFFDSPHFVAFLPVCTLFLQGAALTFQLPAFFLKLTLVSPGFAQLEPHRFLHRLVGSLAFVGGLCYTLLRGLRQSTP